MTPARFRELRQQVGWTQTEAAARLGVTRVTVTRYEAGQGIPEPIARLWLRLVAEARAKGKGGRGPS
jgi:transcriptional regulator with XRE-family HTH domain